MSKKVKKEKPALKEKADKPAKPVKEKKAKKEKKVKEITVKVVKHSKAKPDKEIHPVTGSRFKPATSTQIALELIIAGVEAGKKESDIRKELSDYRRTNGKDRDLDAGYLPFVIASHPEYFECKTDGTITLVKKFTPDPEAAAKLEAARKERLAKKAERKGKTKPKKPGKDKAEKPPKGEKKRKPVLKKD